MNLKKVISKKFPELLVRFVNKKTGEYVAGVEKRKIDLKNKLWDDNFADKSSFIFQINNSTKLILHKDSILSRMMYEGFERNEIEFMKKVLRQGDTCIDIGANVGLFSLIASGIVGLTGKIISFEPSLVTYKRFIENIRLNKLTNIDARNIGLSDKKGTLKLNVLENGFDAWNSFVKVEEDKLGNTTEVFVSTLDAELVNLNKNKISFIKIDVEGWEKFVISGATQLLQHYSPTVMMEFTETNTFSAGYMVQELYDTMESFGYEWFRIVNNNLIKEKKRLHYPYDNLIATKDIYTLSKRIHEKSD